MGFIIFLFLFGVVCFVVLVFGGLFALFFGGKDHYKHERWAEERHEELCRTIERYGGEHHTHYTDARQINLYGHENSNNRQSIRKIR